MSDDTAAGFPSRKEIDWSILHDLESRPHPLVNNAWQPPRVEGDPGWLIEMYCRERSIHHLLDMAGVPHGYSLDTRSIDCRVLLLVKAYLKLRGDLQSAEIRHGQDPGTGAPVLQRLQVRQMQVHALPEVR